MEMTRKHCIFFKSGRKNVQFYFFMTDFGDKYQNRKLDLAILFLREAFVFMKIMFK